VFFPSGIAKHGAGAGVDDAREQKKLEARKILINRAESPASSRSPRTRSVTGCIMLAIAQDALLAAVAIKS